MTNLHFAHFDRLTRALGPRRALPLHRLAQRSACLVAQLFLQHLFLFLNLTRRQRKETGVASLI